LHRLKRGRITPERRLDLHYMTQDVAHGSLIRFLAASQEAGRRCVLVITGKGYRSGSTAGVLRTAVPHWLAEPPNRERVLAFARAATTHGGDGAVYVLLRRLRRPHA
jgi:DNA-nicking Smr family endonuclease